MSLKKGRHSDWLGVESMCCFAFSSSFFMIIVVGKGKARNHWGSLGEAAWSERDLGQGVSLLTRMARLRATHPR
jgi:hypothetical protein